MPTSEIEGEANKSVAGILSATVLEQKIGKHAGCYKFFWRVEQYYS